MLVDWIKHAFILKFNCITHSTYSDQIEALCHNVLSIDNIEHPYMINQYFDPELPVEPTQHLAQNFGLATLPLSCVICQFLYSKYSHVFDKNLLTTSTIIYILLIYLCLIATKSLISICLRGVACKILISKEQSILRKTYPNFCHLPKNNCRKKNFNKLR